jgi:hypothetical protein
MQILLVLVLILKVKPRRVFIKEKQRKPFLGA